MFTFVDGIVAVVLLGSAGIAFMRGFVHEVLAIGAWAGAGFAAWWGFPHVQPWFRGQIAAPLVADGVAALALFLVALLLLSLVTRAVSNQVRNSALNSVDSSLGFVFGLLRGALVLSVAYIGVTWLIRPDEPPGWLANARTGPWLQRGATVVESALPEGFGRSGKPDDKADETVAVHATGNLEQDMRAAEALRATGGLALPQPAAPAETAKAGRPQGYDKDERREMDRLFQTTK
jgi:membrane protein required for colicin V production